ncbi:hypothetical protein BaRGS_00030620 [Batillaria attramentaria]|uniref:Uncharacterized protein n=1 Tax=Batillaria attramentaria TaxID=370345 RepID=A0ABD0JTG4_9CAEN
MPNWRRIATRLNSHKNQVEKGGVVFPHSEKASVACRLSFGGGGIGQGKTGPISTPLSLTPHLPPPLRLASIERARARQDRRHRIGSVSWPGDNPGGLADCGAVTECGVGIPPHNRATTEQQTQWTLPGNQWPDTIWEYWGGSGAQASNGSDFGDTVLASKTVDTLEDC